VAYVLSGEISFKIGDEVTVGGPGTCAFMPRGVPHAWKNTGTDPAACCSCIRRPTPAAFWRNSWAGRVGEWTRSKRNAAPARWEIVGPPPF
jgi:cupin domain